jgi:hypothetical protein
MSQSSAQGAAARSAFTREDHTAATLHVDAAIMNANETHHDHVCPVCDRPMRLVTMLKQLPSERTFVLQCRPCGVSTTKTVEVPGRSEGPAELRDFGWTQGRP